MAKVPEYYNVGNRSNITVERLLEMIEDIYKELAVNLNKKVEVYERPSNGLVSDINLSNGSININTNTQVVEMLVARTATTVTWKTL